MNHRHSFPTTGIAGRMTFIRQIGEAEVTLCRDCLAVRVTQTPQAGAATTTIVEAPTVATSTGTWARLDETGRNTYCCAQCGELADWVENNRQFGISTYCNSCASELGAPDAYPEVGSHWESLKRNMGRK